MRFVLLNLGLALYGIALAGMIRANVGLAPWDAFHVGLSQAVPGLTIGEASIGAGLVCLAAARWCLKMPIGLGSVMNMILIGLYLDFFQSRLPAPPTIFAAWAMFLMSVLGVGVATGTYIASDFGAGPRDSLVIGLHRRTGRSVKGWRTLCELAALLTGYLLGAPIGWGTLIFALTIGPAMHLGLGLYRLKR